MGFLIPATTGPVLFRDALNIFVFDATLNITHTDEVVISEHPLEDGAQVVDHIALKAPTLKLDGVVTNSTLERAGVTTLNLSPDLVDDDYRYTGNGTVVDIYSQSFKNRLAYENLITLMNDRTELSVTTMHRRYENMVIKSVVINRKAEGTANTLPISVELRQIQKATAVTAFIPVELLDPEIEEVVGEEELTEGGEELTEEEKAAQRESIAYAGVEAIWEAFIGDTWSEDYFSVD